VSTGKKVDTYINTFFRFTNSVIFSNRNIANNYFLINCKTKFYLLSIVAFFCDFPLKPRQTYLRKSYKIIYTYVRTSMTVMLLYNMWSWLMFTTTQHRVYCKYNSNSHRVYCKYSSNSHRVFCKYSSNSHRIYCKDSSSSLLLFENQNVSTWYTYLFWDKLCNLCVVFCRWVFVLLLIFFGHCIVCSFLVS
jgi:hypothetical protein